MIRNLQIICFSLLIQIFNSCNTTKNVSKEYPRMIGDIAFDEKIDSTEFKLCNNDSLVVQYYAFTKIVGGKTYLDEKYEVEKIFEKNYNHKIVKKESGNIRIRFLVNCKGVSGRYRIIGMDKNYKEKHFDTSITNQLLSITQRLVKWKPFIKNNIQRDYYQYLIFKIEKGELIEILP
jgi:hypothetical protein